MCHISTPWKKMLQWNKYPSSIPTSLNNLVFLQRPWLPGFMEYISR